MNIKNWQYLCIYGRLAGERADKTDILHDGKQIYVIREEDELLFIDSNTGEILLIQGENGWPTYKSDWADDEPHTEYEGFDE